MFLLKHLHPRRLLPSLTAGLIAGVVTIILEISLAALIFSGDLAGHVASGIGLMLFGAFAIGMVVALTSSLPGTIAIAQDSPAAIFALVAVAIARGMPASAPAEAVFFTVVAAMAVTSLGTGVFFLALGRFKLSGLIRFAPYPVVGGFVAATGWLLAQGAIGVMAGPPLGFSQLPRLLQPGVLAQWLPGLVFGVLLLLVLRRYSHFLAMPAMLLAAIGLFYGMLLLTNTSVAEAGARGWLLGPFPQEALWRPLTLPALAQVNWSVIVGQTDKLGTILIISVISLLLNASGLELTIRQDIDLNRELQSAGLANLVAGLGGSPVGYQTLSLSTLAYRMKASSRLAGLFSAGLCGAALFFGASLLSYLPKPVLGGLLLYLGLTFLVEWVYDAWSKLPRTDYLLVLLILAVAGAAGFLQAVGVGVVVAVVLFVVNYSRINVVKNTLSGANYRSNVDRPMSHRQLLHEKGEQLYILRLQGYIFFGTAQNLLSQIRQRAGDPGLPPLRFVVLGFQRVSGLDSSAVSSFVRMKQLAEIQNIHLVFTHLSPVMRRQLEKGDLVEGRDEFFRVLPTLDHGLEWCENQILIAENVRLTDVPEGLQTQLGKIFPASAHVARLMDYLEKLEVGDGYTLMRQGDPAEALYFVESGQVTALLELQEGKTARLRTVRGGAVVGEVGLYLGGVRTASVVTAGPSTLYRLSADALKQMEEKDPEVAAALHHFIAHLLAERLAETDKTLEAVMD